MWRNDDHLHSDRGPEQVDHLLVRQGGHRHLANLHQSAALSEPSLPGVTVGLHLRYDALEIDMEAQLAQSVTTQGHLCGLTALGQQLEQKKKSVGQRCRGKNHKRKSEVNFQKLVQAN